MFKFEFESLATTASQGHIKATRLRSRVQIFDRFDQWVKCIFSCVFSRRSVSPDRSNTRSWPAALPPAPAVRWDSEEGKRRVCNGPGTVQFHQTSHIALRERVCERSAADSRRQS